ncbi:UDP-glycosyltransferase 87A2 [Apostasia shenzhenica]|uniref:Glycosyltransferase n=1 Tax=Apostasia shenzhenica TaxID=1088818 RepID=A0A2I0AD07_9ASPA|nr:UDP-glycosyltransferase 87A2 [Apostasia shenzhenica]
MATAVGDRRTHIVAVPFPGRGHINPMMNLCRVLATRDLAITVVVTEEWLDLLSGPNLPSSSPALPSNIRLLSVPNILPSERIRGGNYREFFEAVIFKMGEPVERLVGELEQPADVVVADSLLPWAAEICRRRNIPAVSLWTESASVFLALYTFDRLDSAAQLPDDLSEVESLAHLPNFSSPHIAGILPNATPVDLLRLFARKFYWFHTAHSLLMTTFSELEPAAVDRITATFAVPIFPVGPSIPHTLPSSSSGSHLLWLDSQPERSVIYVSLGSFLSISVSQMEEIAGGLAGSGAAFLWIVRDELHRELIRNRVEQGSAGGRGFVSPWCEQLRVLCHPAVGGFLTHCGWNSVMEGAYAGVPMLTFPLFWDQEPNSKLVVEEWGIGLRLKEAKRESVEGMVRELMDLDGKESRERRSRAAEIRELSRKAVEEGGASSMRLDEFLGKIRKKQE